MKSPNRAYLTRQIILQNPEIRENRKLAKLVYATYPALFKNIEDARTSVRYCLNKTGTFTSAASHNFTAHMAKLRAEIPITIDTHKDKTPYKFTNSNNKALVVSDLHIPYVDINTLDLALEYGYNNKVDTIIINGDFCDFGTISKFLHKGTEMAVLEQIDNAHNMLRYMQAALGVKVVLHAGNHDLRLEHYLLRNAPELYRLATVEYHNLLKCKELGVDYVFDYKYMQFGNLNITHGHHVVRGIFAPVNPARGVFIKTNTSTMISHVHRTSEHIESDMNGKIIGCYSIGCITDIRPDYNPQVSKHNKGFAIVQKDASGYFEVDNKKIIDNKIR